MNDTLIARESLAVAFTPDGQIAPAQHGTRSRFASGRNGNGPASFIDRQGNRAEERLDLTSTPGYRLGALGRPATCTDAPEPHAKVLRPRWNGKPLACRRHTGVSPDSVTWRSA